MIRSVTTNLAWLFGERVAVTLLVFASNLYVIRYLGADRFGELAAFQVFLLLTLTVTEFGMRRVFLALGKSRAIRLVLAATLRSKLCVGAALAAGILAAIVRFGAPPQYLLLVVVALLAPLESYVYWFEARLRNDVLARIRIAVALSMAALRIGLCVEGYGVGTLAVTYALPGLLLGLACRVLMRRDPAVRPIAGRSTRDATVRAHVLRRSAFFFASVILVQLHARIDQLLLGALAGSEQLGLYAGAYKFVEQLLMLPGMLTAVLLPAMSRRSEAEIAACLKRVYFCTLLLSLALAATLALGARPLVTGLLGPDFAASARVLAILACGLPGLLLANVSGLFYSLNGLEQLAFGRNFAGLVLGAALAFALIPAHGAAGAAWSMVASYAFVAFGAEWWSPKLRRNGELKLKAVAALFSMRQYVALFPRMAGPHEPQ